MVGGERDGLIHYNSGGFRFGKMRRMGGDGIEENSVGLLERNEDDGIDNRGYESEVDSESPQSPLFVHGSTTNHIFKKHRRSNSDDLELFDHAHHTSTKDFRVWSTLGLAFQTLGVVYGDMGTSPLYVFSDVFSKVSITSEIDILGALSLVMYTIALLPLAKYVFIVLQANDNGEGGTFALYSLICRYAKVNRLPNNQAADEQISSYQLELPTPELDRALHIKDSLEKRSSLKTALLLLVLMGTSMVIGDGILTPAMSGIIAFMLHLIMFLIK